MDFETIWQRFRSELEAELKLAVGDSPMPLYKMMRYHMGWADKQGRPQHGETGKRLRPILCLLSCQAGGGEWQKALPAAAAIELVHNLSLVHDDIQDSSPARRGRATVWHLWGKPQAINVGDGMHVLALLSMLRLEEWGVPRQKVVRAARLLNDASLKLCEGQYLDISYETRLDIGVNDYLAMISGKTAALFGRSFEIGALLGTDKEPLIAHLGRFGHKMGLSFQVHDDILGIWGDEKTMGKSSTSDIVTKKKTLPVVYALEKADGVDREELRQIYQKESLSPADVKNVLHVLNKLDAKGYAQDMSGYYYRQALSELDAADIPKSAKGEFKAIADFLLKRKY